MMFYFAWVDEVENVFGIEHMREDEEVFSLNLTHKEGEFPALTLVIRNPRIGLLAPGRLQWCWVSDDDGPLFFGRLLGLPTDIVNNTCTLNFVARPVDYVEQKLEVADSLKVRPYWDPIWFSPDTVDDPDNVLESRSALWHIDRVTHEVSVSDLITGEDGSIIVPASAAFYDSVAISYSQAPARACIVTASVSWDQAATGGVDITQQIKNLGDGSLLKSYTGPGLVADWPKTGASMGSGWFVVDGSAFVANTDRLPEEFIDRDNFDVRVKKYREYIYSDTGFTGPRGPRTEGYMVSTIRWPVSPGNAVKPKIWIPQYQVNPRLVLGYDAKRGKGETLTFTLASDVQSVLVDATDTDIIQINMQSSEIANPVDPGDEMPLGVISRGEYFTTDRGEQSIEYLLMIARANLLMRARMVNVRFDVSWAFGRALALSCRKNALISDPRLPGGQAAGKISEYAMVAENGKRTVSIVIACTVGKGNEVTQTTGLPEYCDDDYAEDDWQVYDGQFNMPITGVLQYESINGLVSDDSEVDFNRMTPDRVITSLTLSNYYVAQEEAITGGGDSVSEVLDKLNEHATKIELSLVPLEGGPYVTGLPLTVSELMIPKTIDLEAPSS